MGWFRTISNIRAYNSTIIMNTTPKYTNEFGQEISHQQLSHGVSYYSKIYYENDLPIIEETYKDGELVNTSKFVSSENEISDELLNNPNATFDYIFYENGYKVHEIRSYIGGIIDSKTITVYNSDNKIICYRDYEIENGNFVSHRTEKSYYDTNGELLYNFDYNDDGTCFLISNEQEAQADIYGWSVGDPDVEFSWSGFEYYQFADPIIPN